MEHGNAAYIPPQAKSNLQAADGTRFPLMNKVKEFLESDQKVFLLLGDSGAGKSTFSRQLELDLWKSYRSKTGRIPLHINLPTIDKPEFDMIAKQLKRDQFTDPQIREMKQHRTFILICDGYDESQQMHNLYMSNRLNQPGEWDAQMVISCRSEYLGLGYHDRFQPEDRKQRMDSPLFQEAVIAPFSIDQMHDYITQYVSLNQPRWRVEDYKQALDLVPSVKDMVKNPFMMALSLDVLPRMVDPGQHLSSARITRVALYDHFIEQWLERSIRRLAEKDMSLSTKEAFENLSADGFLMNGIEYMKKFAVAIYKEQDGYPIVKYSQWADEGTWKDEFFHHKEKQLLCEACPLIRSANQYRFIHRSLLEYGVALAVFDPQDWKDKEILESALGRRGSISSVLSSVEDAPVEDSTSVTQDPGLSSPLAWRLFVNEPSVLHFLEERAQQEPVFKNQLLEYIEKSKTDRKWRTAAANAITILVRVGHQFNYADLRGIQIPKADLSYGIFDSAQLQGADLRHVSLRGAWLRQTNLLMARMTGVQFGELPFLKQDSKVVLCEYSQDGRTIAAVSKSYKINVYSTAIWDCIWTLSGHSDDIPSIIFSPKNGELASGSHDATVRIWDTRTGNCRHVLGHSGPVTSVVYSPDGSQVASSSHDMTVRIWDVETGDCLRILIGHTGSVCSVKYSPKWNQIASCSEDRTIRLWSIDTEEKEHCYTLMGHEHQVRMVVYSPEGDQVASISEGKTVRLWDTATGDLRHVLFQGVESSSNSYLFHSFSSFRNFSPFITFSPKGDQIASVSRGGIVRLWAVSTGSRRYDLQGHSSGVHHISFSSQGDLIASASSDNTVRLWDAESGVCHQVLTGHSKSVSSVVFSPKGDQVASTSFDESIRLWDVGSRVFRHVSGGHTSPVWKIVCSPKGDQIATCSKDATVCLWDVVTGSCLHTLRGHQMSVNSVAYSPQGDLIATGGSDCSVRLWNVATGTCERNMSSHHNMVTNVAFSPEGHQVASASFDKTVRLWDVASGESVILEGHKDYVLGVVYSPNGKQVASWSWDGTVRLWDVETGDCNHNLTGHTKWPRGAAFSPQGQHLASTCGDGKIRLWDVATGTPHRDLLDESKGGKSIMYSPNGDQLVSGCMDGSIRLWDVETGACLQTFVGHDEWVCRTVYSPQGDMLATVSYDETVRLWNVASGMCLVRLHDYRRMISDITWIKDSDGYLLATSCHDGSVRMWKVMGDGDAYRVYMRWGSDNGALTVTGTNIQDTDGMSELNNRLLQQRGAIGDPSR
jgi:WD40 repeat protein/adenylate kinase family enzyme